MSSYRKLTTWDNVFTRLDSFTRHTSPRFTRWNIVLTVTWLSTAWQCTSDENKGGINEQSQVRQINYVTLSVPLVFMSVPRVAFIKKTTKGINYTLNECVCNPLEDQRKKRTNEWGKVIQGRLLTLHKPVKCFSRLQLSSQLHGLYNNTMRQICVYFNLTLT